MRRTRHRPRRGLSYIRDRFGRLQNRSALCGEADILITELKNIALNCRELILDNPNLSSPAALRPLHKLRAGTVTGSALKVDDEILHHLRADMVLPKIDSGVQCGA